MALNIDNDFVKTLQDKYPDTRTKVAILKVWVDPSVDGLKTLYKEHVQQHNRDVMASSYPNSGFDLFIPDELVVTSFFDNGAGVTMAKLGIKAEMYEIDMREKTGGPVAYFLMPRSSLVKTPLMLANHVGLIDMGYRGEIMGALRNLSNADYTVAAHTRLLQLCHPSALPILVSIVETPEQLSSTARGDGGFGSTGIVGQLVI